MATYGTARYSLHQELPVAAVAKRSALNKNLANNKLTNRDIAAVA